MKPKMLSEQSAELVAQLEGSLQWPYGYDIDSHELRKIIRLISAQAAHIKRLEQARAICTGEFENGLLDNTEGACAGWWRGCDYGYEKGRAENQRLREALEQIEKEYDHDALCARIAHKALKELP